MEELSILSEALKYLKPEIAVSVALLAVVLFDLIFHHNKKILPYISLIGLIITGWFIIGQFDLSGIAFAVEGYNYGMVTADAFGAFFKLIVVISSTFIILFSFSSDEIKKSFDRHGEYYTLIFGMILGMFFMISATDLILIYLSIELLSLSSYVLAGFTKLRDRNSEAALKYLLYGAVSSGLMLFGISIVYGLTGTTNLTAISNVIASVEINSLTLTFAIILIFAGFGYKISTAPFHFWTPDVYEGAPITITAYLSVASKAAGFALLIRFIATVFVSGVDVKGYWQMIEVFDWQKLLVLISILTMTLGNFSALWQNNLKRMLAYSSIAHAGYLLLGLVVLSSQGVIAIMVYFFFYMLMNLGAFYIVMMIANQTGNEEINDYTGIGFTAPFYGVALTIFLISLTGLPPTAGFIGKLYIFIALIDAKMIAVAVIALLNTVVSLYYYARVLKHMYLSKPETPPHEVPASIPNIIVVLLLLIPVLVFGVYFTPVVDLAKSCVEIFGL